MTEEDFNIKMVEANARRGEALSLFAILEVGMQEFIISDYLNEPNPINHSLTFRAIHSEIFQDTHFGFGLLKSLFLTVLKKEKHQKFYQEFSDNKLQSILEKLYTLRNIFAHGTPGINRANETIRQASDESEAIILHGHIIPTYKVGYNSATTKFLHEDFLQEYKKIEPFLYKLPGVTDKKISF